jgi:prepilin-type N-terminal cleavage/methylation domain-containing protein
MAGARCRQVGSRGFTLLELLAVLTLLAIFATMSWPAVRGLLAKGQLQSAAKQLRVALIRARLDAMEDGTVRQFRYQPGTGSYEVSSLASLDEETESDPFNPLEGVSSGSALIEDTLPGDAWFQAPEAADALFGLPEANPVPDLEAGFADPEWSPAVLFFPNGRASNARFRLAGAQGYTIDVTLRGITGVTTIGPLERTETEAW